MTSLQPHKDISHTRLTPIRYVGRGSYRQSLYLYQCICGNQKIIQKRSVECGDTSSCGCLLKEFQRTMAHISRETRQKNGGKPKGHSPPNKGKIAIYEHQNNRVYGRRVYVTQKEQSLIFMGELTVDFENRKLIKKTS